MPNPLQMPANINMPLKPEEIQDLANSIRCLNREQLMGILDIMKDGQKNKSDNK